MPDQLALSPTSWGPDLAKALLSTQQDIFVNSSSQRLLLSSLVTSLRLEIDRKDAIIDRLQICTKQLTSDWETLLVDVGAWEAGGRAQNQSKALEPTTRPSTNAFEIQASKAEMLKKENDMLRVELQTWRLSVRDGEIRLRQAQASQAEADSLRMKAEEDSISFKQKLKEIEQYSQSLLRERDDGCELLRQEVAIREEVIESLRTKLDDDHECTTSPASAVVLREKELLEVEAETVKMELKEHLLRSASDRETIASLQSELRSERGDRLRVEEQNRLSGQLLEDAILTVESRAHHAQKELAVLRDAKNNSQEELITVGARCANLEAEIEELHDKVQILEHNTQDQARALQDNIRTKARSEQSLSELFNSREQIRGLLGDRESELQDIQTKLASQSARVESLQRDLNRSKEVVVVLRRESADREGRLVFLSTFHVFRS